MAIRGPEEDDDALYPLVNDLAAGALLNDTDYNASHHIAKSMEIRRFDGRNDPVLSLEKVRVVVAVTDSRVVLWCKKYEKGGGWVGSGLVGLATMAVANTVSHARVAARRKGNCLVGHARYTWILAVGHASRSRMFSTDELLRITLQDGLAGGHGDQIAMDLVFDSTSSARSVADDIVRRVASYRLANAHDLDNEETSELERLCREGVKPSTSGDSYEMTRVPGAHVVRASTALYQVPESDDDASDDDEQFGEPPGEDPTDRGDGVDASVEHTRSAPTPPVDQLPVEGLGPPIQDESEDAEWSLFCHSCGTGFDSDEESCWKCGEIRRRRIIAVTGDDEQTSDADGSLEGRDPVMREPGTGGDGSDDGERLPGVPPATDQVAASAAGVDALAQDTATSGAEGASHGTDMMGRVVCLSCDAELPGIAVFCAYCGTSIVAEGPGAEDAPDITVQRRR